jgi:alpha-beta hydrolase superfamily lysophospholipase
MAATAVVAASVFVWSFTPLLVAKLSSLSQAKSQMTNASMKQVFGVERNIDVADFPSAAEVDEMEACLPGCEHGWYESVVESAHMHYRKFSLAAKPKSIIGGKQHPKAILVYAHGIHTHSGKAFVLDGKRKLNLALVAERCLQANIVLYAADMYGHGYSEGTRFLIPKGGWRNNLNDLKQMVQIARDENPNLPFFLMGESYGGTLSVLAAHEYQRGKEPNFQGIVLTGPAIHGDVPPAPVLFVLRRLLAPLFPKWRPFFMPNPVSADRIWRDPQVLALHAEPMRAKIDGSGIAFRLGTATGLLGALETACASIRTDFTVPFCIAHGTSDYGVPLSGSEFMYETAASSKKVLHKMNAAYHDLLGDPCAEEAMQYFTEFIEQQLEKA